MDLRIVHIGQCLHEFVPVVLVLRKVVTQPFDDAIIVPIRLGIGLGR